MKDFIKTTVLGALMATAGSAVMAETELRLSVETPPGHVRNLAAERWAEAIEEASGGEMTVEVFPAAQLYKSADAIRALASGALDMSIQANVTMSQFEPNLSFSILPVFFGRTAEEAQAVLEGPIAGEVSDMLAEKGIAVPGAAFLFAPQHTAFTTETVVESYDDLTGLKLATPPSPVVVGVLKEMGGAPQAARRSEIPLLLSQGQIDGMGGVTELTIIGGKLWESGIKHIFADNAGWGFYMPVVSQRTMDKLTDEQQAIIRDTWTEVGEWAAGYAADEMAKARETLAANGVTVLDADLDMVAAKRQELLDLQDSIVSDGGMDADFIARVTEALDGSM
ncbi:TRAP transporter substrate-binding protein DctP [Maritimibacter sp. UBA3975]|uniref:TRAP transporter substrate-binding protein DctP n=1 Tax=Maritimibacter sp. UBA3975 TaxID=1946833 RepID=UPI000C0B99DF|nr:TRAP transporter substrate-binding protein DctP [Maritimibacter sp. UBA3975]MAM60059.1 ABC transporter substrate-binding protein [Maritimibacter sp.]|tara:strand:+ start:12615 stop:13628 length:1014 start_codon:yes stop_codon:yes gene_type:complete